MSLLPKIQRRPLTTVYLSPDEAAKIPPAQTEPETPKTPEPQLEASPDNRWERVMNRLRFAGYAVLVAVELTITALSMSSLDPNPWIAGALALVGAASVFLLVYLFLTGLSSRGFARWIHLAAWGLGAVLFVALNWSWTVGNLRTELDHSAQTQADATADRALIADKEAALADLSRRMAAVNQWNTEARVSYEREAAALRAEIASLRQVSATPQQTHASSAFQKMGAIIAQSPQVAADWWWLGLFLLLQLMTVLVAPRR